MVNLIIARCSGPVAANQGQIITRPQACSLVCLFVCFLQQGGCALCQISPLWSHLSKYIIVEILWFIRMEFLQI